MDATLTEWKGCGLGLRRELIPALQAGVPYNLDFVEVAPENWLGAGGASARFLRELAERLPVVAHGLNLNLGGVRPLDVAFLSQLKRWLDALRVPFYSEHLSWCADEGHLYDLMPLPFTAEAVAHVSGRIRQVQDILGRRIGIENASYYLASGRDEMREHEFLCAVAEAADCLLHLDVNNVFVNSENHGFDAREFIAHLPTERVAYLHVAGHSRQAEGWIVDTHGAEVVDSVWDLLEFAYTCHGRRPTLLERDFNLPPLPELMQEVGRIAAIGQQFEGH